MAKKPSPLRNRLARHQADRHSRAYTALLTPTDEDRSLFEVAWDALRRSDLFDIADADALAERFTWLPAFDSAAATGWIAGILSGSLAYPEATDPLSDPKLCALEADVIAALGPKARWYANGGHPLPGLVPAGKSQGWWPITTATFDRAVVARGNGVDLVLACTDED